MKTATIVVDAWKVGLFEEILTSEGYTCSTWPGVTHDTRFISVKYEDGELAKLGKVVERCKRRAAELRN